jgi:prefoldin subunit 5
VPTPEDSVAKTRPLTPMPGDSGPIKERTPLAVPVGEFDQAETRVKSDKLRLAHAQAQGQASVKRDAADALIGFDDPTTVNPALAARVAAHDSSSSSTARFDPGELARDDPTLGEARGDPTAGEFRAEATTITPPATGHAPTGTLRTSATLPRRRGVLGDLRYVATVIFGLRRARKELVELAARQATRQQSRRHHLITLGRVAVTIDGLEHAALAAARDQLAVVEEERSQHAGHVIAADAELTRVRRDREAKAKACHDELAALDTELAALTKKLEPLEKEVAGIKKRGVNLHEALRRIDAKIAETEASLDGPRSAKLDRAEVQAEIATLRADRKAIQSDEPAIAGQLDAVSPRIASLEAARTEAQRKRAELTDAEQDDQRRVEELLAAIGAKRKVVDRAAVDAETRRDKILFQLGDRLYVDRPHDLTAELAPIDEIDLELGSADRRVMELREVLASVDRWKLARGIALITLVLAAAAAVASWQLGFWP